jgi:hypothetical protein
MRAARVKVTAGRRRERARNLTRDRGETPLACIDPRHFGQQRLRVWVIRPIEHLLGRGTFHDATEIHDQHAIREMFDHAKIVTDEQIGQVQIAAKVHEQIEDLCLNRNIQRGHGFIAHQKFRLYRERTGDAYALALPAGELMWIASAIGGIETGAAKLCVQILGVVRAFYQPVHEWRLTHDVLHAKPRV